MAEYSEKQGAIMCELERVERGLELIKSSSSSAAVHNDRNQVMTNSDRKGACEYSTLF